jgi:hypothetical protein
MDSVDKCESGHRIPRCRNPPHLVLLVRSRLPSSTRSFEKGNFNPDSIHKYGVRCARLRGILAGGPWRPLASGHTLAPYPHRGQIGKLAKVCRNCLPTIWEIGKMAKNLPLCHATFPIRKGICLGRKLAVANPQILPESSSSSKWTFNNEKRVYKQPLRRFLLFWYPLLYP